MQLYDTEPLRTAPMYAGKSSAVDQVQVLILLRGLLDLPILLR
jgi:hypothetical protein